MLVLAWAAVLSAAAIPGRVWIMGAIASVGGVTSLLYALLLTRMWDYHRAYERRLETMIARNSRNDPDCDLSVFGEVNAEVNKDWGRDLEDLPWHKRFYWGPIALSGNHWLLFLSPLSFSLIHLAMLWVTLCCPLTVSEAWTKPAECAATWRCCGLTGFCAALTIYLALASVTLWQCLPRLVYPPESKRRKKAMRDERTTGG